LIVSQVGYDAAPPNWLNDILANEGLEWASEGPQENTAAAA
jgi:hypothetical protein